jgi:hypothetical protein
MSLPQLGGGGLSFQGDALPGFGSLPLHRPTQVFGVQMGVLSDRLRLMLGFSAS